MEMQQTIGVPASRDLAIVGTFHAVCQSLYKSLAILKTAI